jgi:hypothetical protein
MSHFKSWDEIPMRGRTVTSRFFQNPKIATKNVFANKPMSVECHIAKTPM